MTSFSIDKKIKLVVSDLDGTLLSSDDTISKENLTALQALHEKGIYVSIASGRTDLMFRTYIRQLGIKVPVISCNGAMVRDTTTEKVIYQKTINEQSAIRILEFCEYNKMDYLAYSNETVYFSDNSKKISRFHKYNEFAKNDGLPLIELKLFLNNHKSVAEQGIVKILITFYEEADSDKTVKFVSSFHDIEAVSSMEGVLDIMSTGTSKGIALKMLADYLNVDLKETCVFGDNANDVSMLSIAGLSFAMGNAENIAKSAANHVADTNDQSGVSKAIKKYIL